MTYFTCLRDVHESLMGMADRSRLKIVVGNAVDAYVQSVTAESASVFLRLDTVKMSCLSCRVHCELKMKTYRRGTKYCYFPR